MTEVVTGEAVVLDVPVARFPSRMVALLLDMPIQIALLAITGGHHSRPRHLNAASLAAISATG